MTNKELSDIAVVEKIKDYLRRLGTGEELSSVRRDFVREFKEVDADKIMAAEQELLKEGTPLEEVQKLCDVHAALFHGKTREEQIANAERAVEESMRDRKFSAAAALVGIPNHPLNTFSRENRELEKVIVRCKDAVTAGNVGSQLLEELRQVAVH